MRKILVIAAVVLLMTAFFIGCVDKDPLEAEQKSVSETASDAVVTEEAQSTEEADSEKPQATPEPPSNEVHVGLVYSGTGFETQMVINSVQTMMAMSSIMVMVTEKNADAENPAEAIDALINEGCAVIFSVGLEDKYIFDAAKDNPSVNFEIYGEHETQGLANVSAFYARLYQQQYLNGMIAAYASSTGNIGYISQTAQNTDIRRVNAFALGAKAANPKAIVHFAWTGNAPEPSYTEAMLLSFEENNCDIISKYIIDRETLEFAQEKSMLTLGTSQIESNAILEMIEPRVFSYVFEKARQTARNNYIANDMIAGWVNIVPYEINFDKYSFLSGDQKSAVQDAASKMAKKEWDVFAGPITDVYGHMIIPEGEAIPDEDLLYMLWYVGNIKAMPTPMGYIWLSNNIAINNLQNMAT